MDCGVRSVKELSGESALIGLPVRVLRASESRLSTRSGACLEGSTQRPFLASSSREAALPRSRPAPALHRRLPLPASGRGREISAYMCADRCDYKHVYHQCQ
nr:MAG TPA: hypothetical protein [Caudoviricetes sp.]